MSGIADLRARELVAGLGTEFSAAELVDVFLELIEEREPAIGAFAEVTAKGARARAVDADLAEPLRGLPFADKDLTARAGVPTRYGSAAYVDHVPTHSDPLAAALDAAGGISLGKTTTPEFGMTGFTETLIGPPTRNPWDLATGAGGSSGGAAAAVSAGMLPWAPGSDGGGSIRIPAATVGVVGLKPSRGRLPIGSGMDAPEQLAVAGTLTTSVADAAFLLDVLIGLAPQPFATRSPGDGPFAGAAQPEAARGLRVGMTAVSPWDDTYDITLDADARAAWQWAADALAAGDARVEDLPWQPEGYAAFFGTLWRSSAARIPLPPGAEHLATPFTRVLREEGRALSASAVLNALSAARDFERATIAAFSPVDAVLMPALAQSPRPVGWYDLQDPERSFAQQCAYAPYSSFVNVAGLPALTIPVLPDGRGRPVSVQLVGRPGGEAALLALGAVLEQARGPLPRPYAAGSPLPR